MTTPLETITIEEGTTRVFLAPERGGMATRMFVGERPIFFLDEATLVDPTKNVRGGNPVLFPSPGKLEGDRWARDGQSGAMTQHGFARTMPWEVVEHSAASVVLRLASNEATRAVYPWNFVATYRYTVRAATLRIEQRIENRSGTAMPFGAGFHPYFFVPDAKKGAARIPTHAQSAWDNTTKTTVDLTGPIDLRAREVDLHLIDHGEATLALELGDGHRIEVRAEDVFGRWVIWTLAGRDFVCVEPWTAPGNALNTGESLLVVPAGGEMDLWTEIAFV